MKFVILAAGKGTRLGMKEPKPLTELSNGKSIMENQMQVLSSNGVTQDQIIVVVGFMKESIMQRFPEVRFIENERYDETNTSKSLLKALNQINEEDVVWMNGDVVMDENVLARVIQSEYSCMAVNTSSVADEEVKYHLNSNGFIDEVSKTVRRPLGEAIGVNKVLKAELPLFIDKLHQCTDNDYFEKGLETAIQAGMLLEAVDVSDLMCVEIDFRDDLDRANSILNGTV